MKQKTVSLIVIDDEAISQPLTTRSNFRLEIEHNATTTIKHTNYDSKQKRKWTKLPCIENVVIVFVSSFICCCCCCCRWTWKMSNFRISTNSQPQPTILFQNMILYIDNPHFIYHLFFLFFLTVLYILIGCVLWSLAHLANVNAI